MSEMKEAGMVDLVEAVILEGLAIAIDEADHGYSIKLTSLTDQGSVYTLDLCDGSELIKFDDREDAREYAERHRSLARARGALEFLRLHQSERCLREGTSN